MWNFRNGRLVVGHPSGPAVDPLQPAACFAVQVNAHSRCRPNFFLRRLLITFEIACTVVLLIVTGLVVRSFARVLNQPHDFNASHVVLAEVDLFNPKYDLPNGSGDSARSEFIDRMLDKIRSTPGIEFAAITSTMPLSGDNFVHSMYRPDHPLPESEVPTANLRNVSPGYFSTMQTKLIAGRDFTASERSNPQSAIVSQRAAQAAWPDGRALGRKLKFDGRIYAVTGIAADARIANLKEDVPVVYLPFWHDPPGAVFFLVRTSRSLDEFAPLIRRQVWDIDSEAALPVIEMLDTQLVQSLAPERLQSVVLTLFGIAALVLAILGVYGVLAYSVSSEHRNSASASHSDRVRFRLSASFCWKPQRLSEEGFCWVCSHPLQLHAPFGACSTRLAPLTPHRSSQAWVFCWRPRS